MADCQAEVTGIARKEDELSFLARGGEMGALMRAHDWQSTPLGRPETWPQSLRTAVRLILNTGHPMYIWWGPELLCFYNDAYRQSIGPERHPGSIGRPAREVWDEIWPIIGPQIDQVMSGGGATWHENQLVPVTRNGILDDVYWTYSYGPIDDEAAPGGVGGVLVVCTETTKQVRTAEELRQSDSRLRGVLNGMAENFVLLDKDFKIIEVNAECLRLESLTRDQMIGRLHWDVWPEVEASELGRRLKVAMSDRVPVEMKNHYRWSDGREGWFEVRAYPSADGLAIFYRDITERERGGAELRDTAERLSLAVDNAELGFWDVDLVNDVLVWPARTKAMFGISPDAPVSMEDFYNGLHPEDRKFTSDAFAAAADPKRRSLYDVEYRTIGKEDGIVRWVAAKGRGVFDDEGRCLRVTGTAVDISRRKHAEDLLRDLNETLEARVAQRTAELEAAHEQLRQSQKLEAMGTLTGGVAHDFNNLLTPIVGALDMLQRRSIGGEREQRLIGGALQSAERAKTLVQRLLAFARRQPLQAIPVNIAQLVQNMADLIASTTGPQITVVVDVDPDLPPAKADPNQLEMALLNLSVNARDSMPDGGTIRISASARTVAPGQIPALLAGEYLCLSVADTGVGMDEETLARAVEPFFSTKGIGKGTGLGLSMVHGLASQLGGALTITSKVGVGSNIELWLPQTVGNSGELLIEKEGETDAGHGTVLLVDDEELVRLSTADILRDMGYRVVEAGTAEDALRALGREAIDLIVTDHLMPGMTGTELASSVKDSHPDVPVLLISGYAEAEGIAPGFPRLNKPFRKDELAASLGKLFPLT